MQHQVCLLLCSLLQLPVWGGVVELSQRVLKGRPLSDKPRGEEGDYEYDHDAFLGEDAEYFDTLEPEESLRRLAEICDKIDSDGSGLISLQELQKWIQKVQEREIQEDTESQWEEKRKDQDGHLSWESYKEDVYNFVEEDNDDGGYDFKPMMERDERRWQRADNDQDGKLTKIEFQAFLHPENTEYMRDIVVLETLEDMDHDKDGSLSVDEYIGDMYKEITGDNEPAWVTQEKTLFGTERDRNGDGFMDFEEVKKWIIPDDFDHSLGEAKHLIVQADRNGDSELSKKEVLDQHDMFVGSSATRWGEVLRRHDEF